MSTVAALLLAAGGSSRLGEPKQLLTINGETLIHRVACIAISVGCDPLIVVVGRDENAIRRELKTLNCLIVKNPHWESGMGSSIKIGVQKLLDSEHEFESLLMLVCDQPQLDENVLTALLGAREHGQPLPQSVASRYGNTLGPPCCFDRSMIPRLLAIDDHAGAKSLFDESTISVPWPDGAFDVDTPADWAAFGGMRAEPPKNIAVNKSDRNQIY